MYYVILSFPFQDSDASIRKRALELDYLLINESNVKPLTKELIDYLEVSDQEFKGRPYCENLLLNCKVSYAVK